MLGLKNNFFPALACRATRDHPLGERECAVTKGMTSMAMPALSTQSTRVLNIDIKPNLTLISTLALTSPSSHRADHRDKPRFMCSTTSPSLEPDTRQGQPQHTGPQAMAFTELSQPAIVASIALRGVRFRVS